MKKIAALILILALSLSLFACGKSEEPTQLGTSDFTILLPEGYALTEDEFDEDQVAYYYKDDQSVDFDVYQWAKGGQYTLEEEANDFAEYYDTYAESVKINGIKCMRYVSIEEYEGESYTVINYMFEDDTYIVELCFWTVGTAEESKVVADIIGTLNKI